MQRMANWMLVMVVAPNILRKTDPSEGRIKSDVLLSVKKDRRRKMTLLPNPKLQCKT